MAVIVVGKFLRGLLEWLLLGIAVGMIKGEFKIEYLLIFRITMAHERCATINHREILITDLIFAIYLVYDSTYL